MLGVRVPVQTLPTYHTPETRFNFSLIIRLILCATQMSLEEVQSMVNDIDSDKSGEVDFEEFLKVGTVEACCM